MLMFAKFWFYHLFQFPLWDTNRLFRLSTVPNLDIAFNSLYGILNKNPEELSDVELSIPFMGYTIS